MVIISSVKTTLRNSFDFKNYYYTVLRSLITEDKNVAEYFHADTGYISLIVNRKSILKNLKVKKLPIKVFIRGLENIIYSSDEYIIFIFYFSDQKKKL